MALLQPTCSSHEAEAIPHPQHRRCLGGVGQEAHRDSACLGLWSPESAQVAFGLPSYFPTSLGVPGLSFGWRLHPVPPRRGLPANTGQEEEKHPFCSSISKHKLAWGRGVTGAGRGTCPLHFPEEKFHITVRHVIELSEVQEASYTDYKNICQGPIGFVTV